MQTSLGVPWVRRGSKPKYSFGFANDLEDERTALGLQAKIKAYAAEKFGAKSMVDVTKFSKTFL